MVDSLPPVLTVNEAARVLRIGRDRTYELCREKIIPHVRIGRSIRIPRDALLRWIDEELTRAQEEHKAFLEMYSQNGPPWMRPAPVSRLPAQGVRKQAERR